MSPRRCNRIREFLQFFVLKIRGASHRGKLAHVAKAQYHVFSRLYISAPTQPRGPVKHGQFNK